MDEPVKPVTPEGNFADVTPKSDDGLSAFMTELQSLSAANTDTSAMTHDEPVTDPDPTPAPSTVPAETPAPATTPEPTPAPATGINEALIARAQQVGIQPDEARMYTPEMLERSVLIFERNLERIQSHLNQQGTFTAPQTQPVPSQTPVQPQPDEFVLNLDDQFHDPEVVAAVKGMHSHYEKQIKELKEIISKVTPQLETMVQHTQAQAREQFVKQFDAGLDSLGEDFHDIFGKNPQERHANKEYLAAAHAVIQEMNIQSQGFKAAGLPVPPVEELQRRAVNVLHAGRTQERAKKAAQERVAQQLRDQRGQFIQRPNDAQSLGRKDAKAEALAELSEIIRRDNAANGRY